MADWFLQLIVLLLLLGGNGFFALAEIAVVSSRKAKLRQLAEEGNPRAHQALELAGSPTKFLSTVQVGVSLCSILAGAFGGATMGESFGVWLATIPMLAPYAELLSFVCIVVLVTFLSLIVGELVPKSIALSNPEGKALAVAGPMTFISRLSSPVISLLSGATDSVLRIFGIEPKSEVPLSDEEITGLMEEGAKAGVFHKDESSMVEGVLQLDDMPITAIMTPRPKIVWLNLGDTDEVNWRKIVASGHSQFPVFQGNRDNIAGMISVKALYANYAIGVKTPLRDLVVPALYVPEQLTVMRLLETFRNHGQHASMVVDEYGTVQGIVTLLDVMEAIVGDLPSREERLRPETVQREDGSWLIDATLTMEDLAKLALMELDEMGFKEDEEFQTIGSFVLEQLQNIPRAGDYFDWQGWRFEVMDMDRVRVDKVLVHRCPQPKPEDATPPIESESPHRRDLD